MSCRRSRVPGRYWMEVGVICFICGKTGFGRMAQQVTAPDFEWAWKRNLDPALHSESVHVLFDVVGARDYNLGIQSNTDQIGIKALDAYTLEIRLEEPVAYFPYILTLPVTYPLPREVIQSIRRKLVEIRAYRLQRTLPPGSVRPTTRRHQ